MGNIPLLECCPHSYIVDMINGSNSISLIRDYLKGVFEKAGHKAKDAATEGNLMLKIPGLGKTLDIRWKNQVNKAVLLSFEISETKTAKHVPIIATGTLTKGMFEHCRAKGLSVIDSKGNGCINIPGFWYERFVAEDHKRRAPVAGTPFAKKASRLVRAFLSEPSRKWTQTNLVNATGLTQAYVSKCMKGLLGKGYIGGSGGAIRLNEPDKLLDDWTPHYRFDRHIQSRFAFSFTTYEGGLEKLGKALNNTDIAYAYTGWSGAHLRAAYAIPPSVMAYVSKVPEKPEKIGLYPVEHGANCILIEPQDEGVLQFSQDTNGLKVVCDPQLYLDLLRMPGRALDQAQVIRDRFLTWKSLVDE